MCLQIFKYSLLYFIASKITSTSMISETLNENAKVTFLGNKKKIVINFTNNIFFFIEQLQ